MNLEVIKVTQTPHLFDPPSDSHRLMSANPWGVFCGILPQCKHWPLITCLGGVSGWLNTLVRSGLDFSVPHCIRMCKTACCFLLTWRKIFEFLDLVCVKSVSFPSSSLLDLTALADMSHETHIFTLQLAWNHVIDDGAQHTATHVSSIALYSLWVLMAQRESHWGHK